MKLIRIPPKLHQKVKEQALVSRMTVEGLIELAIINGLKVIRETHKKILPTDEE